MHDRHHRFFPALVLLPLTILCAPAVHGQTMPAVAQVLQMEQGSAAFGSQVAGVGDVNGDGFGDLLVGAPGCDQGHTDEGCAYLYFGSPAGFPASPSWSAEGDAAGLGFGAGVAAAGDVDGDGYDDILILASGYGKGHIQEGRVFLYLGSATGPGSREDWKMETNVDNAGPSLSLAGSADLNNDGYAEILIGNPLFSNGQASEGGVMIYTGSDTGPGRDPTWVLESNVENAYFGSAVAAAGDVNGDNYGDVIIGAPAYYASGFNRGAALLFQGSASGPGSAADWIYWNMTGLPFSAYASQVAGAGDVNGDGYDDVIVGTPGYTNSEIIHIGLVDYFPGSDTGLPPAPAWSLSSTVQHDQWGLALCGIGDMNGDGYDDILFTGQPVMGLSGQAFLHLGSADGPQDLPSWQHASPPNEDRYGDTVSGLGDVDGDGLLDWAVGAPMADEPDVDEGKAVVYRACTETDLDGVCDSLDNCVTTVNAGQENGDDDARGDACDCAAGDPGLWSVPGDVLTLDVAHGDGVQALLSWQPPAEPGGDVTVYYDVLQSLNADDFTTGTSCVEADDGVDTVAVDATDPGPGTILYYRVRSENTCGSASGGISCP